VNRRAFIKWVLALGAGGILAATKPWRSFLEDPADEAGVIAEPSALPSTEPAPVTGAAGPLASFFIISDLHINSGNGAPSGLVRKALDDIRSFGEKAECIVITGDVTESGTDDDYKELRSVLSKHKLPPVYANMGNHDYYSVWIAKEGGWSKDTFPNGKTDAQSKETFMKFFGLKDKPYHEAKLKDYSILLMSQEAYQQSKPEVGEGAWYSEEQLEWLKGRLAENKDNKPVFVMIHQSLPAQGQDGGTHRLIPAKRFREILKPHKNVFVFSGHGHQDFTNGTNHYIKETFHWFINSSAGRVLNAKYQHERLDSSQGLFVEVFPDKVVLRGREFSNRTWIKEAEWTVPLQSVKV